MPTLKHPFQTDPNKPPELQPPVPFTQGLIEVYTGDGKGKSTCAFGVALRAVGHGLRVYCGLFMKGAQEYGEFNSARYLPGVVLERHGTDRLVDFKNVTDQDRAEATAALDSARGAMLSGDFHVVILDEINVAVRWKLLDAEQLFDFVAQKPPAVELHPDRPLRASAAHRDGRLGDRDGAGETPIREGHPQPPGH